jgi:hypothetical protein
MSGRCGGSPLPLTQVRGRRGDQLMLQVGGRGEDWKVDGCSLVLGEHPKIMGRVVPSSCGRFGDLLLFFIAAKS